jgi:asparaginyl-tRNA synthetase
MDLVSKIDTDQTFQGWVQGIRGSNRFQFLSLRWNGMILQAIGEKEILGEEEFRKLKSLSQETSIQVTGRVKPNEKELSGVEIQILGFRVFGESSDYPITPKEHGTDFLLNHRHLWLRSKRQLAILRVRSELSFQIRNFFREENYTNIDTPILTGSVGESAGTLFSTEYFDLGSAYLAQTGQLYLEAAMFAHSKVYCFGPTFRAEKSKTRRHLTEFWMLEAETAYFSNEENIQFQDKCIRTVLARTIQNCQNELSVLERDISKIRSYANSGFPVVTYSEAIEILKSKSFPIEWGEDINAEGENVLTDHFQNAVFIKNYPRSIKAFYMKQNPEDGRTVLCADLIAPEGVGEIIGGSEREENFEKILERIREESLPEESYDWYLDLRKFGSVPHSGFGLGLERFVAWICGLPHVRECIPFPRMMYRISP